MVNVKGSRKAIQGCNTKGWKWKIKTANHQNSNDLRHGLDEIRVHSDGVVELVPVLVRKLVCVQAISLIWETGKQMWVFGTWAECGDVLLKELTHEPWVENLIPFGNN